MDTVAPASEPAKTSWTERINFRILLFVAVTGLLIGYPFYVFVRESVTGGAIDYGDHVFIDLKAMSNFEMDQNYATIHDIPEKWLQYNGRKVVLEGEMWQEYSAGDKLAGFQLCYSIAKCCFSGTPKVQHFVDSRVIQGKTVNYYPGLVRVTGTLHVNVIRDAGAVKSVYQLEVENVEDIL